VEEKHLTHSEQLMQLQKVTETTSQHFVEDLWSWGSLGIYPLVIPEFAMEAMAHICHASMNLGSFQ